jgi:hypothetical protein
MKGLKLILATIATLLSTTYAATYYAAQAANTVTVASVADLVTLGANQTAIPETDGSGWKAIDCSSRSDIEAALALDSYSSGADGVKKGSCCINAHHEACIYIQDGLRKNCKYAGKGDNSILTDGTNCPA